MKKIVLCETEDCVTPASVLTIYSGQAFCTGCFGGLVECDAVVEFEHCEEWQATRGTAIVEAAEDACEVALARAPRPRIPAEAEEPATEAAEAAE